MSEEKDMPTKGMRRDFSPGSIIMNQGQLTSAFHTIVSGEVHVLVGTDPRVRVATLGPGEFFGEMACLTGDPVSATVEAVSAVTTIHMDKDGLLNLIDTDKSIRHRIISGLVNRVRQSNVRIQEESLRAHVVTQVMSSEGESRYGKLVGQSEVMEKLRAEIKTLGANPNPVAVTGEPGSGKRHVSARLHYESPRRDSTLLFINGLKFAWDLWEKQAAAAREGTLILDRADLMPPETLSRALDNTKGTRIVLTGETLPDLPGVIRLPVPPLREHKEDIPALARLFLQRALVSDPHQTLSSEALRRLIAYPYLAGNVNELFRALEQALVLAAGMPIQAEHLRLGNYRKPGSRPTVGLALGGGAVRGVAHVGVLKVFEEEGIPIDYIAGSSVGALIGGAYASGMTTEEMEKLVPSMRWSKLVRPVWPRLALCENSRLAPFFLKHTGCKTFEDLRIPFACMAADTLTGEAVVLKSGCLATAIRASTAIPLMMAPVHHQGRTLMDGGVVHKVPAVLARSMGADLVVAVDVTSPVSEKSQPRHLVDALFTCLDSMSQRLVSDELEWADIVIRPQSPVSGYSFKNASAFSDLGEKVTREKASLIRRRIGELAEGM